MKAVFQNSDAGVERGNTEEAVTIEAEWFQLTYSGLRKAPDGGHIAWLTQEEEWILEDGATFTDVVICQSEPES